MESTWQRVQETYDYIFTDLAHPVSKDWLFVPSPFPLMAILISYNIFCRKIGPMLMKYRKPFELKTAIKLYNIFQVLISMYITYEGYVYVFSGNFNFECQGPRDGETRIARAIQTYFMVKLTELLDTIFFVLRKSDRQVTFLHLYHHTVMPIASWVGLKYVPGGQGVIIGTINSLIHVVMYTYYLISGLGPQYQKYLWWKKYLTVMQIVQFTVVLIHSTNSLFYPCNFHGVWKFFTCLEASTFIYMFSKFYYHSYLLKRNVKSPVSNGSSVSNGTSISSGSSVRTGASVSNGSAVSNGASVSNGSSVKNGHSLNGRAKVDAKNGNSKILSNGNRRNGSVLNNVKDKHL